MDPYIKHLNELVYTVQMLSEELEIAYDIMDSLFEDEDYELKEEVLLEKKKWIQDAIKKEGSLRKTMKTKEGKNIPVSKLEKAAEKGGKTGKRARLALTLRKLSKKKKLNEDRAELERAAMNPSGARTPRPSTMGQRQRSDPLSVQMAHQREQGKERAKSDQTERDLFLSATPAALAAGALGGGWEMPVAPYLVPKTGGAGAAAIVAGAAMMAGKHLGRKMGLDTAESDLELEKIRKTAPAQPEEYAKAAKEAAERRKARGIETNDAAMNPSGAPTPRPSTQRERSLLNLLPKHGGAVHLKLPSVPPISSEMQELERDAMNPSGAPTPKPTTMAERRIRENIKKGQTYTGNGK